MKITLAERLAASDAVGWEVSDKTIIDAINEDADTDLGLLQIKLGDLEEIFDCEGGRGCELADRIDTLRIAIAVRVVRRADNKIR